MIQATHPGRTVRARRMAGQLSTIAGLLVMAGSASAHPSAAPHLHDGQPGGLVALLTLLLFAVAGALLLVLRLRARTGEAGRVQAELRRTQPRELQGREPYRDSR